MQMRQFSTKQKRWAIGAAVALLLYSALGFLVVPAVVRSQLIAFAQDDLHRRASAGDISFNPFTLRLRASGLKLQEADGAPLLAIAGLDVEMQWRSLLRRAWSFAHIRITEPALNLTVAPDGTFNLAQLIETLGKRPRDKDAGLPRLVVGHFALERGTVDMRDRRAGYANTFAPIEFSLDEFSTLPQEKDSYAFTAESKRGGKLRWKGTASMDPIQASGELVLENASLPQLAVYLKSYSKATVAAGQLDATLPYAIAYAGGRLEARLDNARIALRDLAVAREGAKDSFAALTRLEVNGIAADLVRREATVREVRADGGKLTVVRDAKGELDLANLMVATSGPAPAAKAPVPVLNWRVAVNQVSLDKLAVDALDETASPPLRVSAGKVSVQAQLAAQQAGADFQVTAGNASLAVADLVVASGAQTPLKASLAGFAEGSLDLAARRAEIGRVYVDDAQVQVARDRKGALNWLQLLPKASPAPSTSTGTPWTAIARAIEVGKVDADIADEASGVKVRVNGLKARLEGAGTDLKKPVKFTADLSLREGGRLSARGSVVPASMAVEGEANAQAIALAPLQPLLEQYLKLKIAGGNASAKGRLSSGAGTVRSPALKFAGSFEVAGLVLNEDDGDLFASWKSVGANSVSATLGPNHLEVPELRVIEPNAKLIIENDRSFNATRLLVQAPAAATPASTAAAATQADPFPIRIRRVRLQDAKLDFTDLSLRPQFAAKIYELNGAINGLSSSRETRSQVELDGRVDEFGLARIRGELNPFAPRNSTDINVIFKNVDLVSASPYSMKFAGYRIAEGKISLDLKYRIKDSQLDGANQIVIDKLTLGERVDSPDAMKLPLELAIAILKDSDGRIDLGLPVSGNIDDPQFSYGAVVWKAIGNVLTRIVTAPFRALGGMFGMSGEKLEAIEFDPGGDKLLPPEREKLKQVGQILAKRAQLKLAVPGHYSEAADGAALRVRAVRSEVARRAGVKLAADEEPGPMDVRDRAVRTALRELYAARFGDAELDKVKREAEAVPAQGAASASQEKLPIWQRVGNFVQGEPQVADASSFYGRLQDRLNREQPLPPDALTQLGTRRAQAILAALKESGLDPARAVAEAPATVESEKGKPIALKLGMTAK